MQEVLHQIVGCHPFAFITIEQNHGGSDGMRRQSGSCILCSNGFDQSLHTCF